MTCLDSDDTVATSRGRSMLTDPPLHIRAALANTSTTPATASTDAASRRTRNTRAPNAATENHTSAPTGHVSNVRYRGGSGYWAGKRVSVNVARASAMRAVAIRAPSNMSACRHAHTAPTSSNATTATAPTFV